MASSPFAAAAVVVVAEGGRVGMLLSPRHRFELTLSQPILIGMRRAAQRMNGQALGKLRGEEAPSPAEVRSALQEALAGMA